MRRTILPALLIVLAAAIGCEPDPARVHEEAFVVDAHSDALYRISSHGGDFGGSSPNAQVDIDKLERGGVDLQFMAVWVPARYVSQGEGDPDSSAYFADHLIDLFDEQLEKYSGSIGLALTPTDARVIRESGRIAFALGIEGGHAIENSLEKLEHFYDRGVRYMTLTWAISTDWAVAARSEPDVGPDRRGLTEFGREVVRKMNGLGMMVDVSHVDENTFWDVLDTSTDPVIASHSCAAALNPHHRNLTDEQLAGLAKNGGVLCINFYPLFLDSAYRSAYNAAEEEYKSEIDSIRSMYRETDWGLYMSLKRQIVSRKTSRHEVTIDTIVNHIDHVVKVAGIDHVGLGSDFDGIDVTPLGMEDSTRFPALTRRLLMRGYSPADVKKILGGNFLRVFSEVTEH